jgi:hypothetical protein
MAQINWLLLLVGIFITAHATMAGLVFFVAGTYAKIHILEHSDPAKAIYVAACCTVCVLTFVFAIIGSIYYYFTTSVQWLCDILTIPTRFFRLFLHFLQFVPTPMIIYLLVCIIGYAAISLIHVSYFYKHALLLGWWAAVSFLGWKVYLRTANVWF